MVPAGTLVVRTAQPLGTLAVYLLEPRSEDGLATWNFFDAGLKPGGDFPVLRLPKPVPISLTAAEPLARERGAAAADHVRHAGGRRRRPDARRLRRRTALARRRALAGRHARAGS